MNKNRVLEISGKYGLYANKRLGQNFLIDDRATETILQSINPGSDDRILEIGPGLGALTEHLIMKCGHVTAVEIDAGLVRYLADRFDGTEGFNLVHGDFLKVSLEDEFRIIVSNLPYYCASEILFRILHHHPKAEEIYVMLQKEMARRIVSMPGNKEYGALTVSLSLYCGTTVISHAGKNSFFPRPDVDSLFIKLTRKNELPLAGDDIDLFHAVVRSAFWGRRKTLLKSLSESPHLRLGRDLAGRVLGKAGIESSERGENLSLDDFVDMVKILKDLRKDGDTI